MEKVANGDMDDFVARFEPLRGMVYAIAYRIAGPNDADDVVMDTYLKAWQALPHFDGRAALKTWLFRIAHNCAVDCIRTRTRRREQSVDGGDDTMPVREAHDETQPAPDAVVVRREAALMVRSALARLPDPHRIALELRYADGLSYGEIAAATGVSIGTVMSRLFNGKRKLQALLRAEGGIA